GDELLLADPLHLVYLANSFVDPFSLGSGFGGYFRLRRDGQATLIHDNRLPKSVEAAPRDERPGVTWYDGQAAGRGPRRLALLEPLGRGRDGFRVHDRLGDPFAPVLIRTLAALRRVKDDDEVAALRHCMRAAEAGHAWARANVQAGMTELDV